jgi:hypothetical protein
VVQYAKDIYIYIYIYMNPKHFLFTIIKDINSLKLVEYGKFKYKFNTAKNENVEYANKPTTFKLIA